MGKLIMGRFQINRPITQRRIIQAAQRLIGLAAQRRLKAGACLVSVLLVAAACGPSIQSGSYHTENPVEIIEKSPRVYSIVFEDFADSVETDRALEYLKWDYRSSGRADVDTNNLHGGGPRETAALEYNRAARLYDAGHKRKALGHVRQAMDADPTYRPPYILLGNLLLLQGRLDDARSLFTRVITWDVTDSEALLGLARCYMYTGEIELAKKALVDAVIFNRYNLEAWSTLDMIGSVESFDIADHELPVLGIVRKQRGRHFDLVLDSSLEECPTQATAWIVFVSQRAVWRYEGKFKEYSRKARYAPTYEEDIDCYMSLTAAWQVLAETDTSGCDAGYLDHISKVADEGYLVPHVLFDYVCLENPMAARGFPTEVIEKMRAYINTYVIISKG
jgi:tetratricopeptide (TPR) repeat protein